MRESRALRGFLSIAILFLCAEGSTRAMLVFIDCSWLLPPSQVLAQTPAAIGDGLLNAALATSCRALAGFAIAACVGIVLGVVMGRVARIAGLLQPVVDLLRPLPSSALLPIAIMAIGFGESTYLFIIAFGALWPILLAAEDGTARRSDAAGGTMSQLRMSRWRSLWTFTLPEAATEIFTGMRVSLSICLVLAVTAEIIVGARPGMGRFVKETAEVGALGRSYLGVLVIALLGFALNSLFRRIESRMPWIINRDEKGEAV